MPQGDFVLHIYPEDFVQAIMSGGFSYYQTSLPYLAMVKNPKIWCGEFEIQIHPLKCSRVLEVVEAHARAKFHGAKCSGS